MPHNAFLSNLLKSLCLAGLSSWTVYLSISEEHIYYLHYLDHFLNVPSLCCRLSAITSFQSMCAIIVLIAS